MRAMAGGILVYVWGKEEFQAKLLRLSGEEDAFVCRGLSLRSTSYTRSSLHLLCGDYPALTSRDITENHSTTIPSSVSTESSSE